MALFQLRWLRRLIRSNTSPIPMNKAEVWKQRLSVAYMFVSLNLIGTIFYFYHSGKPDLAEYYGLKTDEEVNKKPESKIEIFSADENFSDDPHFSSVSETTDSEDYKPQKEASFENYDLATIYYAELLGVKKAHIVRYKGLGFEKVEEFDYEKETDSEKQKTDSL